jgi:hypothetical protein
LTAEFAFDFSQADDFYSVVTTDARAAHCAARLDEAAADAPFNTVKVYLNIAAGHVKFPLAVVEGKEANEALHTSSKLLLFFAFLGLDEREIAQRRQPHARVLARDLDAQPLCQREFTRHVLESSTLDLLVDASALGPRRRVLRCEGDGLRLWKMEGPVCVNPDVIFVWCQRV